MYFEITNALKNITTNTFACMIAGLAFGQAGLLLGAWTFPIWIYREYVKHRAFNEYNKKDVDALAVMTPDEREVFKQGMRGAQSTLDYVIGLFSTKQFLRHPSAYYAGEYASQKAAYAKENNDSGAETLVNKVITKIARNAL
ncbi:MAG: hypothetical protein AB7V32_09450 [Candidatus Berkiella sp.]